MNTPNNNRKVAYDRADNDYYVEPRWCVEALADAMSIPEGSYVWDPCCGGGTIPDVFADRIGRHYVRATDLVDRGYEHLSDQWDATQFGCPNAIQPGMRLNIVTNPPFQLAEAIARRALSLADYRVAVLQQLPFLASMGRHALFTEFPPSDILILSKRPSMPPGSMIAEMGERAFKGGTKDFCWIVWTKGHDHDTRVRWLSGATA